MIELLLEHYEVYVYPVVYVSALAAVGLCEVYYPRRELSASILNRWVSAAALAGTYTLLVRFAAPLLTIPFALWLARTDIGLFNAIDAPLWLAVLVSFLVLDFCAWLQHWLRHRVPILWLVNR